MLNEFLDHIYRQSLTHRKNFADLADLRILISNHQLDELRYFFGAAQGTTPWAPREEDYLRRDHKNGRATHLVGIEIVVTEEDMKPPMVVRLPSI